MNYRFYRFVVRLFNYQSFLASLNLHAYLLLTDTGDSFDHTRGLQNLSMTKLY